MLRNILLCSLSLPMFVLATEQEPPKDFQSFKIEEDTLVRSDDHLPKQIFLFDSTDEDNNLASHDDDEHEIEKLATSEDESDNSKLIAVDEDEETRHFACDDSNDESIKSIV